MEELEGDSLGWFLENTTSRFVQASGTVCGARAAVAAAAAPRAGNPKPQTSPRLSLRSLTCASHHNTHRYQRNTPSDRRTRLVLVICKTVRPQQYPRPFPLHFRACPDVCVCVLLASAQPPSLASCEGTARGDAADRSRVSSIRRFRWALDEARNKMLQEDAAACRLDLRTSKQASSSSAESRNGEGSSSSTDSPNQ